MKTMLKRKVFPVSLTAAIVALTAAFGLGLFLATSFNPPPVVHEPATPPVHVAAPPPPPPQQLPAAAPAAPLAHQDDIPSDNLIHAWRNARESCPQWINAQRMSASYLDVYIIGVQKGATSELCMRLGNVNVYHPGMIKEWHFFERLYEPGQSTFPTTLHMPYTPAGLAELRLKHFLAGFPQKKEEVTDANIPLVDNSPLADRKIVYDATVEYMLSDRAAFLAHALTPHAKVILTLRDPLSRALSQYNMMIRLFNQARRKSGEAEIQASPERFDEIVRKEINKLKDCGYNAEKATLDRPTSKLLECMYASIEKHSFDDLLYVTRGLYHLHINTWRNYYPDHRMFFIAFDDIAEGKPELMKDVAKFLCIRDFPEELLEKYKAKGSKLSFGQQAAEKGLSKMGFESYEGKDKYMLDVLPKTKQLLDEFYGPANRRLFHMLGRKMY